MLLAAGADKDAAGLDGMSMLYQAFIKLLSVSGAVQRIL